MMAATAPTISPTVFVKHDKYGWKVVEQKDLADYLGSGWRKLTAATWLYHKTAGADIFCSTEVEELKAHGWVDSPAKLNLVVDVEIEVKPLDLSTEEMQKVDKVACELLAGEGLNRAALMRALGMKHKNTTQLNRFKPIYKAIFDHHIKDIKKQGMDWFWINRPEVDLVNTEG